MKAKQTLFLGKSTRQSVSYRNCTLSIFVCRCNHVFPKSEGKLKNAVKKSDIQEADTLLFYSKDFVNCVK